MNLTQKILVLIIALLSAKSFANSSTVFFNGDILTMRGDRPEYVEALVIQHDKIMYVGNKNQALMEAEPLPTLHDLKGQTLMPGFIDSWGHFSLIAQNTLGVNLGYFAENPPQTKEQAIKKLISEGKPFNGWILSSGYSEAMLSDGGLSLADLDKAFPEQPLLIQNISTLTGQVNTAGLKKLGITTSTKAVSGFIPVDPKTGKLTGELIGMPFMDAVVRAVGQYSQDNTFDTYRKAERIYLSNGFTTAQSYDVVDTLLKTNPNYAFGKYSAQDRGFKVAGIMVPTDGAPQLRLAYFTQPYLNTGNFGKETGVTENRRTVISHSFFAREDQLAQYRDLNLMAITLPNHIWLYGDVFLKILGEERAKNISPLGEEQKISAYQALQGFTVNAAYQYKEELSKGTLAKGMLADLVILDRNPLKVIPDDIKNIRVLQTIKHGKRLYDTKSN